MTPAEDISDTHDVVRRAGDALPVSPAPVQDLLRQGRSTRRRRTVTTIGVVAVAVVVVTSGAVAVGAQLTNDAKTNPTTSTSTNTLPNLMPPHGMRLVGRNGIGLAIPAGWRTSPSACEGGVAIWQVSMRYRGSLCPPQGRLHSAVTITSYSQSARFYAAPVTSMRRIGAMEVAQYGPADSCAYTDGVCPPRVRYLGALLSRRNDLAIIVTSFSRSEVSRLLASAFAIPDGYVETPLNATPASLNAAGLQPRWKPGLGRSPDGAILGTNPSAGSIVPVGSVVTLLTDAGSPDARACAGLSTSVVTPTRAFPVVARLDPYRAELNVGDRMTLQATGPCTHGVDIVPRQAGVLEIRGNRRLVAVHPGTATVDVSIPQCSGSGGPVCVGGMALLAQVTVVVRP